MTAKDNILSDITFIGFGPSNADVFCDFMDKVKLLTKAGAKIPALKIAIIDTEGNHGAGKPYGPQAHQSSLFSNGMKEVTDGFAAWIRDRKDYWLPILERFQNDELKTWFSVNTENIKAGNLDDIHFPRFLYGIFKREQVQEATQVAANSQIEVTFLQGKVVDIKKNNDESDKFIFEQPGAYEVTIKKTGTGREFEVVRSSEDFYKELDSKSALLGVGSPEPKDLLHSDNKYYFNSSSNDNHILSGSFPADFKLAVMEKYQQNSKKVKLAVLGTEASFLDIVNMIDSDQELKKIVEINAISSTGLPKSFPKEENILSYKPCVFHSDYKYSTPQQFIQDVFTEINHGVNICEVNYSTQDIMFACKANDIYHAHAGELDKFKEAHYIKEFMARTTRETQKSLDDLTINFIPGRIKSLSEDNGNIMVHLTKDFLSSGVPYNKKNANYAEETSFDVVVNCTGFSKTTEIPLIKNGIEKGMFKVNPETKGLMVGKDLSISPTINLNGYLALDYQPNTTQQAFISYSRDVASIASTALINKVLGRELATLIKPDTQQESQNVSAIVASIIIHSKF